MLPTTQAASWSKVDTNPLLIAEPAERISSEIRERFDALYHTASGDSSCVPWHRPGCHASLLEWLNSDAHHLVRPGARAVVVGCGLGDDVAELADRGYDAMGFDIAPLGVDWARRRFPDHADRFIVADLLNTPPRLRARFDLVTEAFTIQSMTPDLRPRAVEGLCALARPHGVVFVIARACDDPAEVLQCECAPYPLCPRELTDLMSRHAFAPLADIVEFNDPDNPTDRCLRGVFRRS